jgi:rare lipoprotein A (peptidoglycan hydrolase)
MKSFIAYSLFIGLAVVATPCQAKTAKAAGHAGHRHHGHHVSSKAQAKGRSGSRPAQLAGLGEVGKASWYGGNLQGKRTANGSMFDCKQMVAAHRSLPLNSKARVTNLSNGKSVDVTVVDRGPVGHDRVIDLSEQAARQLDMKRAGIARVRIEPLPPVKLGITQTAQVPDAKP